jgi:hypothetical protein
MASADKKNRSAQPFVPNNRMIFNIDLGGKILNGKVILKGTVVLTGGAAGTIVGEGGPINLVKRVIIRATPAPGSRYPGDRIVDCTPRALLRYAIAQHSGKFIGDQLGATLGNGAPGTYSVYCSIPIYWADATKRNSVATALNADLGNYSSIQLEVDTGDLTSCFVGNTAVPTWSGLEVDWADDRVALTGDTLALYQEDHVLLIGAAQKRLLDVALPQDGTFDQWLLLQEQSTALTLADSILNKLTVTGPTILYEKYLYDIRQQMLDDEFLDPSQTPYGLVFIDWTDGVLANAISAAQLSVQFDVNNPSGANQDDLDIYTRRVYSPLPASN